ncbi:YceH family protein [Hafnia paralvei ATCC 29927]|uniref:DUF480 domain-containing protein n=1 Tax=Hafnia paralvei TaxID=546367 RepID=A0A2A2MIV1_9GAMM|nr:DUF480 domain-containing protein [Hafnia paralvei]MDU1191228.1 DUF480 domain-containing protein [Enterobacteriaceae bacterium]KHS45416.1 hypothetical protein RN38_13610 [Hafnia paralvei]MCK2178970.1 DUF480 domain-containing protein [Hafnia paralvei]MDU1243076.1 DUF480 domain-containing protein [Enterobacteriaceae bacterium]OAT41064.1 YceH family protein [Hafnia paralvei ATCC 29927]
MKNPLSPLEARVIGCFLEKQVTTPDQYPLSLNGLTTACNQKTNRDPVLELSESDVQSTLDMLMKKHQVRSLSIPGSRVMKYEHRFCNSEFGNLKFSEAEVAVVCCLLLRGPQTPGELRTRTNRLYEFSDVTQVEQVLNELAAREDGPFVVRLQREAGKRESRYAHLFSGEVENVATSATDNLMATLGDDSLAERVASLEAEVAELKARVDSLLAHLAD